MATRRQICRIRVLAENLPILVNSSTRQNGHFRNQTRQTRIRQTVTFCSTRQTRIRQNYGEFSKFGEFGEFGKFMENKVDHLEHTK